MAIDDAIPGRSDRPPGRHQAQPSVCWLYWLPASGVSVISRSVVGFELASKPSAFSPGRRSAVVARTQQIAHAAVRSGVRAWLSTRIAVTRMKRNRSRCGFAGYRHGGDNCQAARDGLEFPEAMVSALFNQDFSISREISCAFQVISRRPRNIGSYFREEIAVSTSLNNGSCCYICRRATGVPTPRRPSTQFAIACTAGRWRHAGIPQAASELAMGDC